MDDVNLVLARIHIAGGILVEREAPAMLDLEAGQQLMVKLPYRFDDIDGERFMIRVSTSIDDEPPMAQEFESTRRSRGGKRGTFLHPRVIVAPGHHSLFFVVDVEVTAGDLVHTTRVEGGLDLEVR